MVKHSSVESGAGQNRVRQDGAGQVGAGQVGVAQVSPGQVRACQDRLPEVGADDAPPAARLNDLAGNKSPVFLLGRVSTARPVIDPSYGAGTVGTVGTVGVVVVVMMEAPPEIKFFNV